MSASGVFGKLPRTEPRAGHDHQTAAELRDELLRHLAKPRGEHIRRHVAQEDHIVLKELAPRQCQAGHEEFVVLADDRIGRPQERAKTAQAHEFVPVEDFFHEPPFPGGFVFDEQQPHEVVDDGDFPPGGVVLIDDFAFQRIEPGKPSLVGAGPEFARLGEEQKPPGLFGREGKIDGDFIVGERHVFLADEDRFGFFLGVDLAGRQPDVDGFAL